MEITNKRPSISLEIRDMLEGYGFEEKEAEGIALAISSSIHAQDTTGLATKGDINDLKSEIKRLDTKIDNVVDKITIRFGIITIGAIGIVKTLISLGWW